MASKRIWSGCHEVMIDCGYKDTEQKTYCREVDDGCHVIYQPSIEGDMQLQPTTMCEFTVGGSGCVSHFFMRGMSSHATDY